MQVRIGGAEQSLKQLASEGFLGQFDLIFIDADKENYMHYYELSLPLVRQGGVLAIDNIFFHGRVPNDDAHGNDLGSATIAKLNDFIPSDERVAHITLPNADGLTLCRKL